MEKNCESLNQQLNILLNLNSKTIIYLVDIYFNSDGKSHITVLAFLETETILIFFTLVLS